MSIRKHPERYVPLGTYMNTLFRKTIKNESDIKDLFLYIVD